MTTEIRALLDTAKTACRATAGRFQERERLADQVEELRAALIEAQRDIHLKMAEAYGEGFTDGMESQKEQE